MPNNGTEDSFYEDISSSSPSVRKKAMKKAAENYGNGIFKHIDKVIKAISFIVSIGILLISIALAAVLIMLDKIFAVVAVGVVIIGIILALIALFLIYATGHIISQNNEIIKRL